MMNIRPMLDEALEEAVKAQFGKLFGVLYVNPTPEGYELFRVGVRRLAEVEFHVKDMLRKDATLKETS